MRTTRVVDLTWIPLSARGLLNSAVANLGRVVDRDSDADVVLLVRRAFPLPGVTRGRVVVLPDRAPVLAVAREVVLAWLALRGALRGRRTEYVSWVPRLSLLAMTILGAEVFVHDLNIFRRPVFRPPFRQPGWLSRAHQHLSIGRASRVVCFSRSVRRQVERCFRRRAELVVQLVAAAPSATGAPPAEPVLRAAMFVDDRAYKGAWCVDRLHSSSGRFELVLIGKARPELASALASRGIRASFTQCDDRQKWQLLQRCGFLLFPSRYEGYGIPPREAALLGVPSVIVRKAALLDVPRHLSLSLHPGRTDLDALAAQALAIPRDQLVAWASEVAHAGDATSPAGLR